jgi:hypothetical protein
MRTSYGRAKKIPPSGSGYKKMSARFKWLLKNLEFLSPYVIPRASQSNMEIEDDDDVFVEDGDQESIENHSDSTKTTNEGNTALSSVKPENVPNVLVTTATPVKETASQDKIVVDITSDTEAPVVTQADVAKEQETVFTRRPLPSKRRAVTEVLPRSQGRNRSGKVIDAGFQESANLLKSVSNTFQNITEKVLSQNVRSNQPQDEISACVNNLESKLRGIKKRERRLRLIDALERIASKYALEDCIEAEHSFISSPGSSSLQDSLQCATRNIGYYPTGVHSVSPPRSEFFTTNLGLSQGSMPLSQQFSSSAAGVSSLAKGNTPCQQIIIPITYTDSSTSLGISTTASQSSATATTTTSTVNMPQVTALLLTTEVDEGELLKQGNIDRSSNFNLSQNVPIA